MDIDAIVAASLAAPGWTRGEEAHELARVCWGIRADAVVVELGAFLGSGTILLAGARRAAGSGLVHCVDPFDGSGDAFSVPHYTRILAEQGGGPRDLFERNVAAAGLSDWVRVHRGLARDVAQGWTQAVDLLFFDGDHSVAGAWADYEAWAPHVSPGGVIALHNSEPRPRPPDHDGPATVARSERFAADFEDPRLVGTTTFARRRATI